MFDIILPMNFVKKSFGDLLGSIRDSQRDSFSTHSSVLENNKMENNKMENNEIIPKKEELVSSYGDPVDPYSFQQISSYGDPVDPCSIQRPTEDLDVLVKVPSPIYAGYENLPSLNSTPQNKNFEEDDGRSGAFSPFSIFTCETGYRYDFLMFS
jgi:hypothetical protein